MDKTNKTEPGRGPDCFKCIYFYLTWETKTPRSCRLYGFKTASMPSVVFYETTGVKCIGFKKKQI
ncbi:MAG: uracil-DNA glycosylase [Oscillospiraceae bacterium]|nr:uracil-DNA glycosylase [Oscillospiraceae bacterium]